MKFIIFFSKLFLDAIRDTYKIIKYFDLVKINGHVVILKLFMIGFFYAFPIIRNLKKKNLNLSNIEVDANKSLNDLCNRGYTEIAQLKKEIFIDIKNEVLANESNIVLKKKTFDGLIYKQKNETLSQYLDRLKKNNVSRISGSLNIEKCSALKRLIISKDIIDIASKYINSKRLSINVSYFISLPVKTSESEKYKNAQYFHWDNDFTKFLKLYIYLSDVDEGSGPHVYIEGTHKSKRFEHSLTRLYSDEEIYESYPNIKKFYGESGSFFFTDSYGLHKGEVPVTSPRIMLNIHFGSNKIKYHANDKILIL